MLPVIIACAAGFIGNELINRSRARAPPATMESAIKTVVERIHASSASGVIFVTGGGSQALSWLTCVPGASSTLLDAHIPYSRDAMVDLLGKEPEKYVSERCVMDLAGAAYARAVRMADPGSRVFGVGCSSSLVTSLPKRGPHEIRVAVHSSKGISVLHVQLVKGQRDRWEEDDVASRLVIKALAEHCDVDSSEMPLNLNGAAHGGKEEIAKWRREEAASALNELLSGRVSMVEFAAGEVHAGSTSARVLLPGSFNPLHEGHVSLLAAARAAAGGGNASLELSVGNVDKGFLPKEEIERRVEGILAAGVPVVVTNAPLFATKAEYFPGSTFVVGWDTMIRLLEEKYYGGTEGMLKAMARLRDLRCKFLVAGCGICGASSWWPVGPPRDLSRKPQGSQSSPPMMKALWWPVGGRPLPARLCPPPGTPPQQPVTRAPNHSPGRLEGDLGVRVSSKPKP
mmetsp:Transcript_8468/g.27668  ORF Transcript_8468/g.27668 Transcript_8468/m.27668 type:complete len:456 (+) Transcript_8468:75-1442(+)